MSVEFADTNIFIYAHDAGAGVKHARADQLLTRLFENSNGGISVQVLTEFYSIATKKLRMRSEEAEDVIGDLRSWTFHRPGHSDLLKASQLHRRYKLSWWDALIVNSAMELDCSVLWTEDLTDGQQFGPVTVHNPFQ